MSSVWDPLGFVSPFAVRGRVFLQELWPLKLDWDHVVDEERLQVWAKFEQEAGSLDELTFPRCYRRQKEVANDFQLHVFSDSSVKAKSTVAYYRFMYESDNVDVTLISARTRVTPQKKQTIPRLEFDTLRMGVNLATIISEESDIEVKRVVFWTDSIICNQADDTKIMWCTELLTSSRKQISCTERPCCGSPVHFFRDECCSYRNQRGNPQGP